MSGARSLKVAEVSYSPLMMGVVLVNAPINTIFYLPCLVSQSVIASCFWFVNKTTTTKRILILTILLMMTSTSLTSQWDRSLTPLWCPRSKEFILTMLWHPLYDGLETTL